MFGIDWDGDGEEGLFDDMVTLDLIENDEEDFREVSNPNGSCLLFLACLGTALAAPVFGIINLLA